MRSTIARCVASGAERSRGTASLPSLDHHSGASTIEAAVDLLLHRPPPAFVQIVDATEDDGPTFPAERHCRLFDIGIFLAGLFTVAQFSFWGNYLPRVYPLHLRGTGEGFAANIGGRMIGTSFAALASYVASFSFIPGKNDAEKMAITAAAIGFSVYLLGLLLSFFLPEPKQEALME